MRLTRPRMKLYASFSCAVVEFLVAFAWAAYVHVENVDFHVFLVLLFKLNHMFERVHAAEVAAVWILVFVSAAHALDESDSVWFLTV